MSAQEFLDGRMILYAGDCREVLKTLSENSVDSVVTDPPYHLTSIVKRFGGQAAAPAKEGTDGAFARMSTGFMGKQWDGGDIAFRSELWAEVLRVLKPGGYILAFSGCRTYHRMACAIEDAGFLTHPMFCWAFGQGFPKAHSVSKQIDKSAGAEREIVGKSPFSSRKPNGSAGVNSCGLSRTPGASITAPATAAAREWDGWFYGTQSLKPALEPIYFGQKPFGERTGAANVLRWGTGAVNIDGCLIGVEGGCLTPSRGDQSNGIYGDGLSGFHFEHIDGLGRWPANLLHAGSEEVLACFPDSRPCSSPSDANSDGDRNVFGGGLGRQGPTYRDSGSAARFFASFPPDDARRIFYTSKAAAADRLGSKHPTVKPLALLQYLVRLVTPRNGICLDLFAGTGTTGEAAFREGFRALLIESEAESIADIERRMALVLEGPVTRKHESAKAKGRVEDAGPLFGHPDNLGGVAYTASSRGTNHRAARNEEVKA